MPDPIQIQVPQEIANDDVVRIVKLLVANGQFISYGDVIAEVETSKSGMEIYSSDAGWVELRCASGEDIAVGATLAVLHATEAEYRKKTQPQEAHDQTLPHTNRETVFSKAALAEIELQGLPKEQFQHLDFVRKSDVSPPQVTLPSKAPSANTAKAEPQQSEVAQAVEEAPFKQTLCEDWAWHRLLRADLFRLTAGDTSLAAMLRQWWTNPGFNYMVWYRVAIGARKHPFAKALIYPLALWCLLRCHRRFGIRIPLSAKVGPGLLIGHWGGIWINPRCTIGANCNLSNDLNVGEAGSGDQPGGVPQLGDNVYLGPGARLAGPIRLWQESAVMANTLVTSDLPAGSVAIGVPHRITARQALNRFVSSRCDC